MVTFDSNDGTQGGGGGGFGRRESEAGTHRRGSQQSSVQRRTSSTGSLQRRASSLAQGGDGGQAMMPEAEAAATEVGEFLNEMRFVLLHAQQRWLRLA